MARGASPTLIGMGDDPADPRHPGQFQHRGALHGTGPLPLLPQVGLAIAALGMAVLTQIGPEMPDLLLWARYWW